MTPAHNAAAFIVDALRSVEAQTVGGWEHIVVDDGSSDGTAEVVASAAPHARLVRQAQGGAGAARNAGCRHARGEYICFLDADDLLLPWAIEAYLAAIESCASRAPELVLGRAHRFRHDPPRAADLRRPERPVLRRSADALAAGQHNVWLGAGALVVRREAFEAVGGFREGVMLEDLDLFLRLGERGPVVQILEPDTMFYRVHADSLTRNDRACLEGVCRLLALERQGELPGGRQRQRERRAMLARAARSFSFGAARRGRARLAMEIYLRSLPMQLSQGKWRFAAGLPAVLARGLGRRVARRVA